MLGITDPEQINSDKNKDTGTEKDRDKTSQKEERGKEKDIEISLAAVKKHWPLVLLIIIMLCGFYLRVYHIDYPVVGYHNWKETHYLTEARNFARDGFFKYGFFVPENAYPQTLEDKTGVHSDTFPLGPILTAVSFKIFGFQLWAGRIIGILATTFAILFMYLTGKEIFKREDVALTVAALAAINPLFVFFSHNVELVNVGLLCITMSAYFFFIWRRKYVEHKHSGYAHAKSHGHTARDKMHDAGARYLLLFAVFYTLGTLTKYPFAVMAIPLFFLLPFNIFKFSEWKNMIKDIISKSYIKQSIASAAVFLLMPLWFFYSNFIIGSETSGGGAVKARLVDLELIFDPQWWAIMNSFIRDNYTMIGFIFALLGVLSALFLYLKKKDKFVDHTGSPNILFLDNALGERFIVYSAVATALYFFVMSAKLSGHSYHQYPIAPFIIIAMAYFIAVLSGTLGFAAGSFGKAYSKPAKWTIIIVLFLIVLSPSLKAKDKQFDTQFMGLDVAGEYIKAHSQPDERIFFSGEQSFGVLWHADRMGYDTHSGVEQMKKAEKDNNYRWIFMYQWGFATMQNKEDWDYIKNNYSLKQFGFVTMQQNSQPAIQPIYFLFEKGGSFNETKFREDLKTSKPMTKNYEYTMGIRPFFYVEFK